LDYAGSHCFFDLASSHGLAGSGGVTVEHLEEPKKNMRVSVRMGQASVTAALHIFFGHG
jgi:hypothetical protein